MYFVMGNCSSDELNTDLDGRNYLITVSSKALSLVILEYLMKIAYLCISLGNWYPFTNYNVLKHLYKCCSTYREHGKIHWTKHSWFI